MSSKKKSKKKTTTGAGINTPMLGVPSYTQTSNKSNSQNNDSSLEGLEQKTMELKEKLQKIKSDAEQERALNLEETYQLNSDITDKNFEINVLSGENRDLIAQLKEIKNSLDEKMKIGNKFLVKMEKLKKEEEHKKKLIEVKDKEIELAQKNQDIAIRDYNRIKNISDNNYPDKENELRKDLESLENDKKELENEIIKLRKIIKDHKLCPKEKQNLISNLNIITNSYQFEEKKKNMLESNLADIEEKKEKIKQENKENKEKLNMNNRSNTYGNKIRSKVLERMEKKNSEKSIIPSRAALHVANLCKSIGDNNLKNSRDIKNSNNTDYKMQQKCLFTDNEQMQLATIIPPSYLNKFKEKFDEVENQRYDLIDKIKVTHDQHTSTLNSVKIKLNYTELKKKEQKILWVDLNSNLAKKNMDITKLKTDINKIIKDINMWKKLLRMKNNESKKLNKYIDEFKNNKNKNGNIEESKRNSISKKKKELNLQKQNNINLAYNMEQ